jgi:hypothetical protein
MLCASFTALAYDFAVAGVYFNKLSDNTCKVTYRGSAYNSYSGDVVIPQEVNYDGTTYAVTTIGYNAFYNCAELSSISIPNSVTTIEWSVFYGCSALTEIVIPNSVTTIGSKTFAGCTALTSITLPNALTTISQSLFEGCKNLRSVDIPAAVTSFEKRAFFGAGLTYINIPSSVTSIGEMAFYKCFDLSFINIPNSVTTLGNSVFEGCTSLHSATIGNSVMSIPKYAFYKCTFLQTLNLGSSLTSIGEYAFEDCTRLKTLTIPNSVKTIQGAAFAGCTTLTTVTISDSVTTIGDSAFSGCTALTYINMGRAVEFINGGAFAGCDNLVGVNIKSLDSWCNIRYPKADETSRPLHYAHHLYLNNVEIKDLAIPYTVNTIRDYAFAECTGLKSVTICSAVDSICHHAFYGCSEVDSLVIGSGKYHFGDYTFYGCNGLKSVTCLRKNADYWTASEMFSTYDATLYVPIGSQNKYENYSPWWYHFKEIVEKDLSDIDDINIQNVYYKISSTTDKECRVVGCRRQSGDVVIPESISVDGVDYTVTNIAKGAFNDIVVSSLSLPYTASLNATQSDDNVIIKDATIGTLIVNSQFITDDFVVNSNIDELVIKNGVEQFRTILYNNTVNKITIEDGDTELQIHGWGIYGCQTKELYLGRNLTGGGWMESSLENLTIGSQVTNFVGEGFRNCSKLTTVIDYSTTPQTSNLYFSEDTYANGTLYVPDESLDIYSTTEGWKEFYSIKPLSEYSGLHNVVNDAARHVEVVGRSIHIGEDCSNVLVTSVGGVVLYAGHGGANINVTPGIYVVVINHNATRVYVK